MKRLVRPEELAKASHMRPGDPRITLLTEVSGLKRLEKFYHTLDGLHDLEFVAGVFRNLDLELDVAQEDLTNIPGEGGLLFVANHPYGAIDGLALVHVLASMRPDLKVMANFLLQQLEPLRDRFIGVNPFEEITSRSSFQGMRQAMEHVRAGGALAVFPAGEVSSWHTGTRQVADPRWKLPAIKLVQHLQVPVVPVWFDGANSFIFQMLGMIHPSLRTLALPKEMMRMRGRSVKMRIGKPIPAVETQAFNSAEQLARYLRAKTYALGSGLQVRRDLFQPLRFPNRPKEVIDPIPVAELEKELDAIQDLKLNSQGEFDLFLAPSHRIPNVLREIGRCREITFRAVGEGTNKALDLDEFDIYYDHLFLWDKERKCLAGSYRIGDGRRIMARYGKRGFYTYTLFRMDRQMDKILRRSFELGRSFISLEHQKQRLPLYMLWRGLLLHVTANPQMRYLIGPVSISSNYSRYSRALIMNFVEQHHCDPVLAKFVSPRNRFKVKKDREERETLVQASNADLKKMDRLIADIDPKEKALPVLLKKYILLNGKVIGFNRDPRFNDALDGFIVLDLAKVPSRTIEDLKRGMDGP